MIPHLLLSALVVAEAPPAAADVVRPPAIPLVASNPHFSSWSRTDRLTDSWPTHWTGANTGACGLLVVDGQAFRWCGTLPAGIPAAEQRSMEVTATRTRYTFDAGGLTLVATFCSPVLADDPDLASRAVAFLQFEVASADGRSHKAAVSFDCAGEWAVHDPGQAVMATQARLPFGEDGQALELVRIGVMEQRPLARVGDHVRIDWGWMTLAAPPQATTFIGPHETVRRAVARDGRRPEVADLRFPRPANDDWPVIGAVWPAGTVDPGRSATTTLLLAYDEGHCVEWMGRPLRPYWARDGRSFAEMLADTWTRREEILGRAARFDAALATRLRERCGPELASLNALVYRQVMAAHCIATDFDGTMLMFSKENTSNGCIGTVDVLFPTAPFFLALNPDLLEAQLRPILAYAASPRWRFAFAPHDLGTYPKANGQVYGGGERSEENQMPVEECGNMLILVAALERAVGSRPASGPGPAPRLADRWSPQLRMWAEYLREHGLDPTTQLCTDDFAGHLARNANLSVKAIVALGAYADLIERCSGDVDEAGAWRRTARDYALRWAAMAADGDYTVLAFGAPGTWSLKYNLIWDKVLALGLFPPEIAAREVAWYRSKTARFGAPMDSRVDYTKPEWLVWSACLASDQGNFLDLVLPIVRFANETPDRVPMTDWYTVEGGRTRGMHSRSVVGGMYMPLLLPTVGR